MKKPSQTQTIVLVLVVLLLLGGLGWYLYSRKKKHEGDRLREDITDAFDSWLASQYDTLSAMQSIVLSVDNPSQIKTSNRCLLAQYHHYVLVQSEWDKTRHYIQKFEDYERDLATKAQAVYQRQLDPNSGYELTDAQAEFLEYAGRKAVSFASLIKQWLQAAPFLDLDNCIPVLSTRHIRRQ
jgi:LPXTG-motif cell wall-anchored protein